MKKVYIYDTLLRDGLQGEGVSMSCASKLKVAMLLDVFGVDYIEGGYAASNPKIWIFSVRLRNSTLSTQK